jgi:hypothetical protein
MKKGISQAELLFSLSPMCIFELRIKNNKLYSIQKFLLRDSRFICAPQQP